MRRMKTGFFWVLCCALVMSVTLTTVLDLHAGEDTGPFPGRGYVPGELLVKYRASRKEACEAFYRIQWGIVPIHVFEEYGLQYVRLPKGMSVEDGLEIFERDPDVEYAEPNRYFSPSLIPDDTYFDLQWAVHNTGQDINGRPGTADADIDGPEAWALTTGSPDVIVALIDSGVDYNHPDLSTNIWINTAEAVGNNIDDDGNGLIDDIRGWDFVDDDNDPMDAYGHGTFGAGIIAAKGNNQRGVAGINFQARIMILRIINAQGAATTADAVAAVIYANEKGADVINISWGVSDPDPPSQALRSAIEASRAVVVCAAGNDGSDNDDTPFYPASYEIDHIIAVASSDQNDDLSSFSNFGAGSVDVAAPGENILSCRLSSIYGGAEYIFGSGTSGAAAHVSGLAALVKSLAPTLSNREIKAAIENHVDAISSFLDIVSTGGRINAYNALMSIANITTSSAGDDGGGGGGGGGCFIATAAFGSPLERRVKILSQFRDRYLLTNAPGRAFVKFYYSVSPSLAGRISESKVAATWVRWGLLPLVIVCQMVLHFGAPVFLLALVSALLLTACLVVRRKEGTC